VPLDSVLDFLLIAGGWIRFGKGSTTLYFWVAHQVLDKRPQRTSSMPRGQGSSSQSSGSRASVARPSIESCKLLLENTFAIKEEFSNNEATSWAVKELKRWGLKRLFKPIASIAYKCLVREFYKHLRIDCHQPRDLLHHHQPSDVFVTFWFIFTPLALHFLFSISAHCGQCKF
jgi:hypothetical protein